MDAEGRCWRVGRRTGKASRPDGAVVEAGRNGWVPVLGSGTACVWLRSGATDLGNPPEPPTDLDGFRPDPLASQPPDPIDGEPNSCISPWSSVSPRSLLFRSCASTIPRPLSRVSDAVGALPALGRWNASEGGAGGGLMPGGLGSGLGIGRRRDGVDAIAGDEYDVWVVSDGLVRCSSGAVGCED